MAQSLKGKIVCANSNANIFALQIVSFKLENWPAPFFNKYSDVQRLCQCTHVLCFEHIKIMSQNIFQAEANNK